MRYNNAGKKVFDMISKMDDDEAQVFTMLFADEVYDSLVSKNQRAIRHHNNRVAKESIERAERVAKAYRDRGEEEAAEAVLYGVYETLSKTFNEADHNRAPAGAPGSKGGQFTPKNKSWSPEAVKQRMNTMAAQESKGLGRVGLNPNATKGSEGVIGAGKQINQHLLQGADNRPGKEQSTTDRAFRGINQAGELASGIGGTLSAAGVPGGASVAVAGEAAKLASNLGPNAEKIAGPAIRRAKYRSQGVERTIDPELKKLAREVDKYAQAEALDNLPTRRKAEAKLAIARGERSIEDFLSADDKESSHIKASTRYLHSRLPDMRRNSLREGSGKIAPSEGIIIDSKGNIAHQSVGVAEDHYLPFSAKNLKDLQGGSYVRSRTSGGLTSEDLRTGLRTGARSMTVVSHSGVFQVDFDKDFVGNARKSSRARQMVDRYEKLLDAVQSKQVKRHPLTASEKLDIEDAVDAEIARSGGLYNDSDRRQMIRDKEEEAVSRPRLSKEEIETIENLARKDYSEAELATDRTQREIKRNIRAMKNSALEAKGQRVYSLNGQGYQAALKTLEEEFPYFINVQDMVQFDKDDNSGVNAEDSGYVKPRFLHPEKENHGYFGEGIAAAGSSKIRGDRTQYQNYAHNAQHYTGGSGGSNAGATDQRAEGSGNTPDYKRKQEQQRKDHQASASIPAGAIASIDQSLSQVANLRVTGIQGGDQAANDRLFNQIPTLLQWGMDEGRHLSSSQKRSMLTDPDKAEKLYKEAKAFQAATGSKIVDPLLNAVKPKWSNEALVSEGSPALPYSFTADQREELFKDPAITNHYAKFIGKHREAGRDEANKALRESSMKLRAQYQRAPEAERENLRRTIAMQELMRNDIWDNNDTGPQGNIGFSQGGPSSASISVGPVSLTMTGNKREEPTMGFQNNRDDFADRWNRRFQNS